MNKPQDSPQPTKQSKNKNTKSGECICTICQDPIVDATETREGQDSIFCEGQCSAWIHRQCAGLSKSVFDFLTQSEIPFHCPHCTLQNHTTEIAKLKEVVNSLTEIINKLTVASAKPATSQSCNNQTIPQATQPPEELQIKTSNTHKQAIADQKFNSVMYRVKESPPNTNRSARLDHDLTNITQAFSETEVPLERNSIKDCHRLGKFNEKANKPRPILVTFLRSGDASLALSRISSLKGPVRIKPDLSPEEARKQYC